MSHSIAAPSPSSASHRPSAGGGYFEYHGFWSPGVRVFRSVAFSAKAMLIALAFLVPLATLSWSYFTSQAASIEFSAKERLGIEYANEVLPLAQLLQLQRLRAAQEAAEQAGGTAPVTPAVAADALKAALAKLDAVQAKHGEALASADAFKAFQAAGQSMPGASAGLDAVFAAHTARVQALLNLMGVTTDNSNLTLDPDIDTYYLMDAAMFRLPVMMESAAQVRGIGTAALNSGKATPGQTRLIVENLAVLNSNLAAMEAGIAKAVAYNAEVSKSVSIQAMQASLKAYLALVEANLLSGEGVKGDAAAYAKAGTVAVDDMVKLASQASRELDALVAARVDRIATARNLTAGVLVIGLALAVYLFVSFGKVLSGGLREVTDHLNAMRDGILTTEPHAWGRDEVANLMVSLGEMQSALRRIVSQVRTVSDRLVTASAEISGGAADLQSRTEQSAANLEETASAMEQIASTVKNNEETVEEATKLAGHNAKAAERGGQIISQVATTMESINHSSGRIGDIIGTIDGIAFQTNILALNAAVEAARAGEQGRGFAVVASEVRALAQRTSSAAKEIKALITTSMEQVEGGVRVVKEAGQTVGEIVGSSKRVSELLAEVATGAREQTMGVAQSAKAVQQLDSVTQQNAALVEQTAASASTLTEQAQGLASEVAKFKL